MDVELLQKKENLQMVFTLGLDKAVERQYVLKSLDSILPDIVREYDAFFDPERRRARLMEAQQFEREFKALGEEAAHSSRRDAKQKFLREMGLELEELRKKEAEWIERVIEPFSSFQDSHDFDPVDRLLNQYQLPEFLKKALWVTRGGSQPEYSEDGFSNDGVPNYTRILVKHNKLVLHPGFRGRKASINDYEPDLTSEEKAYGPTYGGCLVDWGTWWCKIGDYDPLVPDACDKNGWTALHHACDSGFSKRAFLAAQEILAGRNFRDNMCEKMQQALKLKTVGSQPNGFTALHFACDGANRCGDNQRLVHALLQRQADIEAKDARGNTPLLKAAGQGLTDVCEYLIACKADVNATDNKGVGAAQKTKKGQKALFKVLYFDHHCPWTFGEQGPKQWNEGGYSASRALRYEFGAAHPAHSPYGKGGEPDNGYRAWKSNQRLAATDTENKGQWRGDRRWGSWGKGWDEGWYERQWGEQHPHGHASKGSSSSNSWNQSAHDSSRWGN